MSSHPGITSIEEIKLTGFNLPPAPPRLERASRAATRLDRNDEFPPLRPIPQHPPLALSTTGPHHLAELVNHSGLSFFSLAS